MAINNVILPFDDGGNHHVFETGAKRDIQEGKGMFSFLLPEALFRWAKRCEIGHLKYGNGRNWESGMPISKFIDSALRHITQYMLGDDTEDHIGAAIWNLACICQMENRHPEMQDIPTRNKNMKNFLNTKSPKNSIKNGEKNAISWIQCKE